MRPGVQKPDAPSSSLDETLRPGDTPPRIDTPLPESERFEFLALIGSGGMGKVYKAFDRKLKRLVALKLIRGADPSLEKRFLMEAQAQARVDHPNVCKVYEVGRIGDEPYIAMQFIDGKTLRDVAPELTLQQKLGVVREIAAAVESAHKLGLVHRDIKPANILVERALDGTPRPFITDFGLARDLESPGDTVQGALIGTPHYMAPEQARGDHRSVDARTDVYGLGATLYEALVGKPPFEGATHMAILYKMLHEDAPAPHVSREVDSVVLRCLEKEPERRYSSAKSLADDLQRALEGEPVQARPVGAARRISRWVKRNKALTAALSALVLVVTAPPLLSLLDRGAPLVVAVADVANQTGDEGLDGLSGMLITSLEQTRKLTVLTRARMFDLVRQTGHADAARIDEPLGREVAQKAGAAALILPSVRRFDDLYSIDLKVLDPRTNEYVVALSEEGKGKASIPRIIDHLSEKARKALKQQAAASKPVEDVTTRNLEAYQHFFRGDDLAEKLQFSRAADELKQAVAIDPEFALAWYRLAYTYMWMHDGQRARDAIDRALKLREKLPAREQLLAQGVRASVYSEGRAAYETYKECATKWPDEKECHFMLGDVLFHGGYVGLAVPLFKRALELDPSLERAHQHLIWAYQLLGKKDDMLAAAQTYVARVGNDEAYGHLGRVLAARGETDEARRVLQKAASLFPRSALPTADLAGLAAWQFDVEGAVNALAPMLEPSLPPRHRLTAHLVLGGALVQGGRVQEALRAFESAAADSREAGDTELESIALAGEALVRYLYLHDADGARRIAANAVARGVPETMFAFVYPLMGDVERYAAVLKSAGDPLADRSVAAFESRTRGDFASAAQQIEALSDKSPYRDFLYYVLADAWMQAHDDAKAIDRLLQAQRTAPGVIAPGPGYGGMFRARSDYQLGVLYERSGQPQLALAATQKFLAAWKHADAGLPELADARARVARLSASGSIPQR